MEKNLFFIACLDSFLVPPDVSVITGPEKYTVDKVVANILFCFVKEIVKRFAQIR